MPAEQPERSDGTRRELVAAPPFLSWRALYVVTLALLALEIAGCALLTVLYR